MVYLSNANLRLLYKTLNIFQKTLYLEFCGILLGTLNWSVTENYRHTEEQVQSAHDIALGTWAFK